MCLHHGSFGSNPQASTPFRPLGITQSMSNRKRERDRLHFFILLSWSPFTWFVGLLLDFIMHLLMASHGALTHLSWKRSEWVNLRGLIQRALCRNLKSSHVTDRDQKRTSFTCECLSMYLATHSAVHCTCLLLNGRGQQNAMRNTLIELRW